MYAGMQLSLVGVGLPGLTGCTLLLTSGVVRLHVNVVFVVAQQLFGWLV